MMNASSMSGHRRPALWTAVLAVLVSRVSGETLYGSNLALGVDRHGDAQALSSNENGRHRRVIRRELADMGEIGNTETEAVGYIDSDASTNGRPSLSPGTEYLEKSANTGRRHGVIRQRRSASGSRYAYWKNVSGFEEGKICRETGHEKYEKHIQDEESVSLQRCMDHCETTFWCSTLSFHGNRYAMTDSNVCVIVGYPCTPIEGKQSNIENATDNNWLTMNYSFWEQADGMENKHCEQGEGITFKQEPNVASLEDCFDLCLPWPWCKTVDWRESEGTCNLVSSCSAAADKPTPGSKGSQVFTKGNHDPPPEDGKATPPGPAPAPPANTDWGQAVPSPSL